MRMNQPVSRAIQDKATARTFEGGAAIPDDPKLELVRTVSASMLGEGNFYESGRSRTQRIDDLCDLIMDQSGDIEFLAHLAVYTRHEMNLRTVALHLALKVAEIQSKRVTQFSPTGKPRIARWTVANVIARGDEPAEILAGALAKFGARKNIPRSVFRGVRDALDHLNEFTLSRYAKRSGSVSMRDVFRLVHPKPGAQWEFDLYQDIAAGAVIAPENTWEKTMSGIAKDDTEARALAWVRLIPDMGLMALLRNLRNMLQDEVFERHPDSSRGAIVAKLSDPKVVLRSLVLPMRYLATVIALEQEVAGYVGNGSGKRTMPTWLFKALDDATLLLSSQVDIGGGNHAVVIDCSFSMTAGMSDKSMLTRHDAALMLAGIVWGKCLSDAAGLDVITYNNEATRHMIGGSGGPLLFAQTMRYKAPADGWTYIHPAIQALSNDYDTVWIFTDGQAADAELVLRLYGEGSLPTKRIVYVDIGGYATTAGSPEAGCHVVAGLSDRLFEYVALMDNPGDLVGKIDGYTPQTRAS